jgi:hypothetical protein
MLLDLGEKGGNYVEWEHSLTNLDGVTVPSEQASLATTKKPNDIDLWHYRLAHM